MRKYLSLISTVILAFALTGCATLFGENDRTVAVNSTPQGAEVYVNNQPVGVTPTNITVTSTWSPTVVTFKKPGYQVQTATINNKFQVVTILDVLFWPTILVDVISGDAMKVDPASRSLNVPLTRSVA